MFSIQHLAFSIQIWLGWKESHLSLLFFKQALELPQLHPTRFTCKACRGIEPLSPRRERGILSARRTGRIAH